MAAKPRITPSVSFRPWKQPWQVCFVPCWQHWTMRPWRMPPPFQHVFLLRPYERLEFGSSRWLYVEWSFMGACTVLLDEHATQPLHRRIVQEGAMLHWRGNPWFTSPHMGNGLWPTTCVTFARQVLGLPFRYRIWTPLALWHELVDKGATIVVDPFNRDSLCLSVGRKDTS